MLLLLTPLAGAVSPTPDELAASRRWSAAKFEGIQEARGAPAGLAVSANSKEVWLGDRPLVSAERAPFDTEAPFSFKYAGQASAGLLKTWPKTRTTRALDEARLEHTLRWHDPKTGLETRCVAVEYKDFPTVEWTLFFKNSSSADTPVLSDVQGLDTQWERSGAEEFVLHHHKGTFVRADDFEPLTTVLTSGAKQRFAPPGGRPLGWVLPYFNVDWSGQGVILAIGWPGQWAAAFQRDGGIGLRVLAGQESTNLRLHPGEEIRSPLIVLQFWSGDWIRAQNVWRRWMLAHTVPRREGKLPAPMMPAVGGNQFPGLLCNEADEIRYIDRYLEERIPITHWWMDAGWYEIRGDWTTTGTWEIDAKRFPRGLRSISDHAHANGLKLIVWFEPERVTAGSRLAEQHAEWVLGGKQGGLLDLGNPLAWQFNRPEVGSGIVQAFRRADSIYRSAQLQLRGLDPAATYEVTDLDAHRPARVPGHELPEPGLIVELPDRPAAALLTYRRVTP